MRVIIQRVQRATLRVKDTKECSIGAGLYVLVGVEASDTTEDMEWLASKTIKMRIFDDEQGVMNLSGEECGADLLIVSQFTLHASTKKGNRPSYIRAARPEVANPLYEAFVERMRTLCTGRVETGCFGAEMFIDALNHGPVTIVMDSKNRE